MSIPGQSTIVVVDDREGIYLENEHQTQANL